MDIFGEEAGVWNAKQGSGRVPAWL